jgi:hypothetical protein
MQPVIWGIKTKVRDRPAKIISGIHQKAYLMPAHTLAQDNLIPDYTIGTFHEAITYSTQPPRSRGRSNFCLHNREYFNYSGGSAGFACTVPSLPWSWELYQNHNRVCCDVKDTIVALAKAALGVTGPGFLNTQGQGLINTAFDRLRPDLTTVSVPNFLAEIDDIKRLHVLWKKKLSLARNLAGAHLNYKFGWKPTVADIREMIEAVLRTRAKLAAFKESIGKIIQSSTSLPAASATVSGSYRIPSSALATWTATITRSCNGFIAYKPRPLDTVGPLDAELRALLDALGFELNPRILWDLVPFTFIVDWFFGVGEWLDRFSIDTLELPIYLVDAFLQYKEVLTIEWRTLSDHLSGYTPFPLSAGAVYRQEFFHRMPLFPDYTSLSGLGWRMPTLNQAALGVSLATVLKK